MEVREIKDLELRDLNEGHGYDVAVFASGYEARCTYIPRRIAPSHVKRPFILGFEALADQPQRVSNDRYFDKHWSGQQIRLRADEEGGIYDLLREVNAGNEEIIRVLVDYSSMSRLWYAGILNWARFSVGSKRIEIDFAYAAGQYGEGLPPLVIEEMMSIPGFEGGTARLRKSLVIFGLGFAGEAALCLLDRLEPDLVYAYLAPKGELANYDKIIRKQNRVLLEEHALRVLELPLNSVERTFGYLAELVAYHLQDSEITLAPMGPKPHVLAAMLVSLRFQEVSCLRISSKRQRPDRVAASGKVIATRVVFEI